MPSAANAKSDKPASSEATDNSPIRQVMTIIEHKIRNLEKRKGKLTQYRDLQKAGKELNSDQRVAVAKYDEVAQTLEFARDIAKQIATVATVAERDAKKQAKKDAWVRNATETSKIREVLLILDCLTQMGTQEAREDFLNGTNGAAKLTEDDLKILDDLYPEVTPKHEPNEEGQPGFHAQTSKAAEHLCSIIDGKPKEVLGTTYTRIKEIVSTVHECGYFDRVEVETVLEVEEIVPEEQVEVVEPEPEVVSQVYPPAGPLPVPPAPAVVPTPAYPLRPLPPITLQEVEHAYFAQQYPQQRPIAEVIGSQNFFFLQESEIDSPTGTPQPPVIPNQLSPPGPIPTQTFTNQHFIQVQPGRVVETGAMGMPPQPHFAPLPEHPGYPVPVPVPLHALPGPPPPQPPQVLSPHHAPPVHVAEEHPVVSPPEDKPDDDWIESASPERDETGERKSQGQGDGQGRYRRFGRGGGRGAPNGHRGGRGSYQGRQGGDGYRGRHGDYQGRSRDEGGYQGRSNRDEGGYQGRSNRDEGGYQGRSNREEGGYQGRSNRDDGGYQGRSRDDGGYQGRSNKDDGGYQGRSNKEDGGYQGRSNKDDSGYQGKSAKDESGYQGRSNRDEGGYRSRQYDGYQHRHSKDSYQNKGADEGYYGNGDTGEGHREQENGGRDRYGDGNQSYQGGFKGRGRGGPRGAARGSSRPPRASHNHYNNRKQENVE